MLVSLSRSESRNAAEEAAAEVADRVIEPCCDDPFPDYDTEPVIVYANA